MSAYFQLFVKFYLKYEMHQHIFKLFMKSRKKKKKNSKYVMHQHILKLFMKSKNLIWWNKLKFISQIKFFDFINNLRICWYVTYFKFFFFLILRKIWKYADAFHILSKILRTIENMLTHYIFEQNFVKNFHITCHIIQIYKDLLALIIIMSHAKWTS